ncbi:MAG: hypothetical protein ACXW0Z_22085 [Gemmatirosa sp.]
MSPTRFAARCAMAVATTALVACADDVRADAAATPGAASTPSVATLAAGTVVGATIQEPISSRTNHTGDRVRAVVSLNVVAPDGRVVIPGGSTVELTIARLRAATSAADGEVALDVAGVAAGDAHYTPSASVGAIPHTVEPARAGAPHPTDRDVLVTAGTPITIRLTQPLAIATR